MKRAFAAFLFVLFVAMPCIAAEKQYEFRMSVADTFIVSEKAQWKVEVEKSMPLRLADVRISPRTGEAFSLLLYFKCDTQDLSQFDTPEKIKRSIINSSQQYVPYSVEKEIRLKELKPKNRYGYYTVHTDAKLANVKKVPVGSYRYITRGMIRLSDDSVLGFSLMTNDLDSRLYKEMMAYIVSFVKGK